jgi:hypothetical protein
MSRLLAPTGTQRPSRRGTVVSAGRRETEHHGRQARVLQPLHVDGSELLLPLRRHHAAVFPPQVSAEHPLHMLQAEQPEHAEQPVQQSPTPVHTVTGLQLPPLSEATRQPSRAAS